MWAHARRKFYNVAKASKAAKTAHEAVERIQALFMLEREMGRFATGCPARTPSG